MDQTQSTLKIKLNCGIGILSKMSNKIYRDILKVIYQSVFGLQLQY